MEYSTVFFGNKDHKDLYPDSPAFRDDGSAAMVKTEGGDRIALTGSLSDRFSDTAEGEFAGEKVTLAPLTHENAEALRALFPYTAPSPMLSRAKTVGLGDRLGIASDGHIQLLKKHCDVFPILAQQSMRELVLTGRTYCDVLDAATFSVFRQGFRRAWGADGDHLKNAKDIKDAIAIGYSMITLDCGEHIRGQYTETPADDLRNEAKALGLDLTAFDALYTGSTYVIEGNKIAFTADDTARLALIYGDMLDFATEIYYDIFDKNGKVDFEISIDEVANPTSPAEHFFIANELARRGVRHATLAPRFCGEFQKGIDYIGDPAQFEKELAVHAAIARYFGYKISVHSGSDKFSVFPAVGRQTRGVFHVKTAGTNYLEAMRIVSKYEPKLYREIHAYALDHFTEATKYYHVTTDLSKIPALDTLSDAGLPALFNQNDARQLIHICYGVLLMAKKDDGTPLFRDRLYAFWADHADEYADALEAHIGRHFEKLGI